VAPVCRSPIAYRGQDRVRRDIANLKAALAAAGLQDGYLNAVAPGSCGRFGNEFYDTDEELIYACADAMREEYQTIIDAGLTLRGSPAIRSDRGGRVRHLVIYGLACSPRARAHCGR
jgi:5-methyltetrahydropteroyltriglutamate--homocysteine methyltransferase